MSLNVVCQFDALISWYQVVVHDEAAGDGYNGWLPEHVRQGFSWRPGSVSFATLDNSIMQCTVALASHPTMHADARRAFSVPFKVSSASSLYVAASLDRWNIRLPAGDYALYFQHGVSIPDHRLWGELVFVPEPNAVARVLVADAELNPPDPLLLSAQPAL